MTHPPAGPVTPPPPSGPRHPQIVPLDPDSPGGRAVARELTEVLAQIRANIAARRRAAAMLAESQGPA